MPLFDAIKLAVLALYSNTRLTNQRRTCVRSVGSFDCALVQKVEWERLKSCFRLLGYNVSDFSRNR